MIYNYIKMIYIIITTSIHNKIYPTDAIHRQNRYIQSIQHLLELTKNLQWCKPIIVENNGERQTYLDDLYCDVLYTTNNKFHFPHKGQNELLDIKDVINKYQINNDDVIIKLTGRYKLLSLDFIELVKNNNNIDAFVKFFNVCTLQYMYDDCVLGLFSIKCKYLKEFNYTFLKSAECDFAEHVRKYIDPKRLMEINHLDLECCFADDLRILTV